ANRLASNSLVEGLVYGARAGEAASRKVTEMPDHLSVQPILSSIGNVPAQTIDVADVQASLKSLMGRLVGVQRDRDGLQEAAASIESFMAYVMPAQFTNEAGWELQNMLSTASLIVQSALAREESRGVHFRLDHPQPDDEKWRLHLSTRVDQNGGHPTRGALLQPQM
ncbi:MAG: L-aspartate oxidase, partial [Planctomycetota bacterium]